MPAYYNEINANAAAWLRELIKQGHIADGVVDERSIVDVRPDELQEFTQCHFFAGIGVWSYALRSAGWSDDRRVWTGSCPCQPFSAAGARGGFDDQRHLWPHWHHLISQCRPPIVFGEQVASKDGLGWLDLVCADMEATGYAIGAADLCAAGVGAPHIRQRLWFVGLADASVSRLQGGERVGAAGEEGSPSGHGSECCGIGGLADADRDGRSEGDRVRPNGKEHDVEHGLCEVGLADTAVFGRGEGIAHDRGLRGRDRSEGEAGRSAVDGRVDNAGRPSSTNGFWRDADWLFCRDGKWRPVEPGTFPLAHGSAARVGRLRGYGNAISAPVAQTFIESVMDIL